MSSVAPRSARETLTQAARELRSATAAALAESSFLATTLDDCRADVERVLSLTEAQQSAVEVHALELRAELVLRTWRRLQTGSYRALSGERPCQTCERGTLIDVARAGRMTRYRGVEVEIPETFAIPTCNYCYAESLDPATEAQFDDLLLQQYLWRKS